MDALASFAPATRTWFQETFPAPTAAQMRGWPAIASGEHTLIHAPTGSGKTLAAFLWALDRLMVEPGPPKDARCRVLYVSPLKALAHDVERNLREPLRGIATAAERLGLEPPGVTTFIRTGDTPATERRRMERQPPRRGYFVEGLGGAQFALPGAVDRIRSRPSQPLLWLAATDPANLHGSVIPWPETETRLAREAGAYVIVEDGNLLAYLDKARTGLTLFAPGRERMDQVAAAVASIGSRHRRLTLRTVDGSPAGDSPLARALAAAGFATAPRGLTYRG